jgi:hypothetical protein
MVAVLEVRVFTGILVGHLVRAISIPGILSEVVPEHSFGIFSVLA